MSIETVSIDKSSLNPKTTAGTVTDIESFLGLLQRRIEPILPESPESISVYELVKKLTTGPQAIFSETSLKGSLPLFQTNFLVMHSLYKLQENLSLNQISMLTVSSLKIFKTPCTTELEQDRERDGKKNQSAAETDNLRRYYLDLKNLFTTSEEDVNQLLKNFWEQFSNPTLRLSSLQILGLDSEASISEIQAAYRRLAMLHHPDRGGAKEKFIEIQEAYVMLKSLY